MAKNHNHYENLNEVELIVRAAGGYVQASKDLRPRVLDAARAKCSEQRLRRYILFMSFVVFLFTIFTTSSQNRLKMADTRQQSSWFAVDADNLFLQSEAAEARHDGVGWNLVDAFTESRRRQAEALRLEL